MFTLSIDFAGFDSTEKPLHYEYLYSTGHESVASVSSDTDKDTSMTYSILFHSPEGNSPAMTLPMGFKEREYQVDIRIHVMDAIGATVEFDTFVKVNSTFSLS